MPSAPSSANSCDFGEIFVGGAMIGEIQDALEVPFFGLDWDQFTITTGDLPEIDACFDPGVDPRA